MRTDQRPEAKPTVTVVIPARYGSSRFPGKPLAQLNGMPLIQHVYERTARIPSVDCTLVATDDERIARAVRGFGGEVVLSETPFRTGTDRVAALARQRAGEIFVNLQGDESPLHPELLSDLIVPFLATEAPMGTLKRRLTSREGLRNAAIVKVVTDQQGRALYFTRAPVPCVRDAAPETVVEGLHFMHLGIYIFRRATLLRLADLPTSALEAAESLEQLRALEHGIPIQVWETRYPSVRIDTPEDLRDAARVLRDTRHSTVLHPLHEG